MSFDEIFDLTAAVYFHFYNNVDSMHGLFFNERMDAFDTTRQAADVEARLNAEEAEKRERASEIRREERLKKIKFMADMDDSIEVGAVKVVLGRQPSPDSS